MEAPQTLSDTCPVCLEAAHMWLLFRPCNHFSCCRCGQGWLRIKHECLQCRTATLATDLLGDQMALIEENVPLPPLSKSSHFDSHCEQSAAEGLSRQHFIEELTKLLQLIHFKHSSLGKASHHFPKKKETPSYSQYLQHIEDTVLDSLEHLSAEDGAFDPLALHHLIYEIHQDILSVDSQIHAIHWHEDADCHYDEDYSMQESQDYHYPDKSDFAIYAKKPKKKKNANRKQSAQAAQATEPAANV